MTLFATTATALFVPRDSPLSQVELLTRDRRLDYNQREQLERSRDEPATKGIPEPLPQLGATLEESSVEPRTVTGQTAVDTDASQQRDMSLQWLALSTLEELECHLRVSI
jgi:hypothetical protein